VDHVQALAAHALADKKDRAEKTVDDFNKNLAFSKVKQYSRLLSRDLIVSMANNFNSYLSEILQSVMTKKHEVLRSSERITIEDALQFNRVQELRAFIVDRKINELSYAGQKQIQEFIAERLGIEMFSTNTERVLLTILNELRNIHTHNRGTVNQLFLNRIGTEHPQFPFVLRQQYHVDFGQFVLLSRNAIHVAQRLDELLAVKFKLKRSKYKNRLAKGRKPSDVSA